MQFIVIATAVIIAVIAIGGAVLDLATAAAVNPNSPVVLVPGDGGTQLWVSLNNTNNHWYCQKSTSSPTLAWLELEDLVYPAVNCMVYNIKLKYNPKTGTTTDNDGVRLQIRGFGGTETVEWLSNVKIAPTGYYNKLVDHLVDKMGYSRGVDVHGAPFDFRKAPNEMAEYFVKLRKLIETTYNKNGQKRVVLVGHSLGCKIILHFLHTRSQVWKDKYVKNFVAAAGPFGGAASSFLAAIAGYNLGLSFIKPIWVRESQRSWPSTFYLTPSPFVFNDTEPIVSRPGRQYSLDKHDLKQLFHDIGFEQGFLQYEQFGNLTMQTRPPGVTTVCVYGHGVKTSRRFKWQREADFPDKQPDIVYGDGDGTVNIASLDVCLNWGRRQNQSVKSVPIEGAEHLKVLVNEQFIDAVAKAAATAD